MLHSHVHRYCGQIPTRIEKSRASGQVGCHIQEGMGEVAVGYICWLSLHHCKFAPSRLSTIEETDHILQIRIIYRLIEFSAGHDQDKNPLPYKEIYLYILEVIPMFSAIGVFIVVHPGNILKEPDAKMPGVWSYLKNRKGYRGGDRRRSDMMMLKSQDGSGVELVDK